MVRVIAKVRGETVRRYDYTFVISLKLDGSWCKNVVGAFPVVIARIISFQFLKIAKIDEVQLASS